MYCIRKITPAGLSQPFRTLDSLEEGKRWIIQEAIDCAENGLKVFIGNEGLTLCLGDVTYAVVRI